MLRAVFGPERAEMSECRRKCQQAASQCVVLIKQPQEKKPRKNITEAESVARIEENTNAYKILFGKAEHVLNQA